jgi:hypothetical protein
MWGTSAGLFAVMVLATASLLPERVASHFNAAGQADAWVARSAYLPGIILFGLADSSAMILVCALARWFPPSTLNVPKAALWRQPEHHPTACRILFLRSFAFAAISLIWVAGLHVFIIRAHHFHPPRLDSGPMALWAGAYVLAAVFWIAGLCRRYARGPEEEAAP